MNREQYEQALQQLKEQYEQDKSQLHKQYAVANNTLKIGDIATDHIGTIQIERVRVAFAFGSKVPECVYDGVELKKDGTPKKNEPKRRMWQSNLIK